MVEERYGAYASLQQEAGGGGTRLPPKKIGIASFEIVRSISKGAYGAVYVGRKRETGDVFAIKVLKRSGIRGARGLQRVLTERNVLASSAAADNPFIVKLFYSFAARRHLYLVLEYMPGGDLAALLKQLGAFPPDMARFYVTEILAALQWLHARGIVHRDLKPDNVPRPVPAATR